MLLFLNTELKDLEFNLCGTLCLLCGPLCNLKDTLYVKKLVPYYVSDILCKDFLPGS